MRYRIAFCGFSEFEHHAMRFSFNHPATPPRAVYELVDSLLDADYAVVDAGSKSALKSVQQAGRVANAVFVGAGAPEGALARLPRPIDPTRILRTLDELTAEREAATAAVPPTPRRSAPPRLADVPVLDDSVVYAPRAEAMPVPPDAPAEAIANRQMPPAQAVSTQALPTPAPARQAPAKADKRAAARSASRRARLVGGAAPAEPLRDVLVLDADATASALLCDLLARFGFAVHAVASVAEARLAIVGQAYAAIFVDVALDDSDGGAGLDLLQRVHRLPAPPGRAAPAVLLVAPPLHPADRVIASLAGVGVPLEKPVTRGAVARALESRGVVLPADARRV